MDEDEAQALADVAGCIGAHRTRVRERITLDVMCEAGAPSNAEGLR